MPRGVPHAFRVESEAARMLGVMSPGDFEHLFRDPQRAGRRRRCRPRARRPDVARVMAEQRRAARRWSARR